MSSRIIGFSLFLVGFLFSFAPIPFGIFWSGSQFPYRFRKLENKGPMVFAPCFPPTSLLQNWSFPFGYLPARELPSQRLISLHVDAFEVRFGMGARLFLERCVLSSRSKSLLICPRDEFITVLLSSNIRDSRKLP